MFFDGMIDEVRVYNRPLNLNDVVELYGDTLLGVGTNDPKRGNFNINVFPNPVAKTSTIDYSLKKSANVEISIFDQHGHYVKQILNKRQPKGDYQFFWDTKSTIPGVYICRFAVDGIVEVKKIIVID